jgi:hypothetical protein
MVDHNAERPEPRVIAEVGGDFDETHVTLALYADDLDPDAVSTELGCSPSHGHRKGEARKKGPPARSGAWYLKLEAMAPRGPNELLRELLARFPVDPGFWSSLVQRYKVRITVAVHTGGWNRGCDLSPEVVAAVARTGAEFGFDLYMYGEGEEESE